MKTHLLSFNNVLMVTTTLTGLIATIGLFVRMRKTQRAMMALEERYGVEMQEFSRDLDTVSRRSGEHRRRIAWLETRLRKDGPDEMTKSAPVQNVKPTITERRHRVLTLARRGQEARAIAQTLGMPHGEVELMINLHAA